MKFLLLLPAIVAIVYVFAAINLRLMYGKLL